MKFDLKNNTYDMFITDILKDDKNNKLNAFVDHEAKEIVFCSKLSLEKVDSACQAVALSILLDDNSNFTFLTAEQKDLLVNWFVSNFKDIDEEAIRLKASLFGFLSRT